ncbi:MAG: Stp1/IreP family PP2C-type Ser/Thr phosphatase [Chloroflexia bacterium]
MTATTARTETLPFDKESLHALPEGAILDGRYTLGGVIERGPSVNLYRARARGQQRCSPCGALSSPAAQVCARCGTALNGDAHAPEYVVVESNERNAAIRDPAVVEQGLNHPNLARLVDTFSYAPYGSERYYSVSEAGEGTPLDRLPLPQPAATVLGWGEQLSDALGYLHNHGVLGPDGGAENVLIDSDRAVLANLHKSRLASHEPEERAHEYAEDNAKLAGILDAVSPRAPSRGLRSGRISDLGRRRELNEDSLSAIECQVVQESVSASVGVYAVADGMGGHAGGEVASGLAIAAVTEGLLRRFIMPQAGRQAGEPAGEEITRLLTDVVRDAAERVHAERVAQGNDMGTTLVAALVAGQTAYIANLGDSRAYILEPDGFRQITVDHSLVQQLVDMGQISEDEAKTHPYRSMIYKSLGEQPDVEADIFVEQLMPGTRILLCSDGLSGMVPDERLREVLSTESDPQAACARLIAEANEAGGTDNITAVAVYVEAG